MEKKNAWALGLEQRHRDALNAQALVHAGKVKELEVERDGLKDQVLKLSKEKVIRPFCIMLLYRYLLYYGLLLHIILQYLCLSLLFYKVYMKRENVGSWNSRLEKEQILETYSAQLQKS